MSGVKQTSATARECATELLEAVPLVMRVLRAHARGESSPELSMPQFRALAFVGRNEGAMLLDVAAFLGLTPPAASKLVDGLVAAGLVTRKVGASDRRCMALTLRPGGRCIYRRAVESAERFLAEHLAVLGPAARGEVVRAMRALRSIFDDPPEVRAATAGRNAAGT
jgi:DNA-binding MarR family transcriptional regulator